MMEMDDDVMIIEKPTDGVVWKREKGRSVRSAIDEDECCILDTDPAAAAMITAVASFDTEELVMTRESGPVCVNVELSVLLTLQFHYIIMLFSSYLVLLQTLDFFLNKTMVSTGDVVLSVSVGEAALFKIIEINGTHKQQQHVVAFD